MKRQILGAVAAAAGILAVVRPVPATEAPATTQPSPRPNILFAVADDASLRHMSAYSMDGFVPTPNFDRVAREGVLFRNCFTPLPKCSPSRASILTGMYPWQLEDAADHFGIFPAKFAVYPDLLERAGYAVGFTGKGWGPGDWKSGGFNRNPAGTPFNALKLTPPTRAISNIDYAANFHAFLSQRQKGQPFCFWYGANEPHRPYAPGSGVRAGADLAKVTVPAYLPDETVVRSDLADYGREVQWFDEQLGKILTDLADAGELDRTLVVVTSDNGMPFPRVKGHIYEDACHMPLAIRWPGVVKPGRTVDDFVSFADLAPTYLEAAGLPVPPQMTGKSLLPLLLSAASGQVDPTRDHVLLGRERTDLGRPGDQSFPVRAIRTPDWLYCRNYTPDRWPAGNPETGYADIDDSPTKTRVLGLNAAGQTRYYNLAMAKRGPDELYDMRRDPDCLTNLADNPHYAAVMTKLRQRMEKELSDQKDPRIVGGGEVFDHYEYRGPRKTAWQRAAPHPATQPAQPAK